MATTLFNGSSSLVLPTWTAPACLAAFETAIQCDPVSVQLLTSPDDHVGWTTSMLQGLCTSNCQQSLSNLHDQVASACGSSTFYYGLSGNISYASIIELRQHSYNIACMQDSSTQQYCLDVERSWNISALVASGQAQWPQYTTKGYPDYSEPGAPYFTFANGSLMSFADLTSEQEDSGPDAQNAAPIQNNWAGQDWYIDNRNATYSNYGWNQALAQDEYPLSIQCSSCFVQKLQYGIQARYGHFYDEILAQIWSNLQQNCNLNITISPANNVVGLGANSTTLPPNNRNLNGTDACLQYVTAQDPSQNASMVAAQNNIPLAALLAMNDISNIAVGAAPLCAPVSCQLGLNDVYQDAQNFVYARNMSLLSFLSWNPYVDVYNLAPGEAVCIGPPGGAYKPTMATAANATVYSTTATPAAPTVSGTINYCGLYYNVSSNDYCNLISQRFGISLAQLLGMNSAIYSDCSNLYLGYDYCVAPCCGSSAPVLTTSRMPSSKATSGVASTAASTTTSMVSSLTSTATSPSTSTMTASNSYVPPPGPTQSGASLNCYKWYTTQSGDYCYAIEQQYGITADQFLKWNPELDSNCNIYAGYSYCVSGP